MERKGGLRYLLLIFILIFGLGGCAMSDHEKTNGTAKPTIKLVDNCFESRQPMPDENIVYEARILIYDDSGKLEAILEGKEVETRLITGRHYTVLAYANMEEIPVYEDLEDILKYRHSLNSPYDYENGIPMNSIIQNVIVEGDTELNIRLERLMSKISIRVDRSKLSEGVKLNINRVTVGNCPANAFVFKESRVEQNADCFDVGFKREDTSH